MKSPVITIDGPSGTGKGTVSALLAKSLGWHILDSGAIYRAFAWASVHYKIEPDDEVALADMWRRCDIRLITISPDTPARVFCNEDEITHDIRHEQYGMLASKISMWPLVRNAVLPIQRDFRRNPGLIADGRDMGTIVFPDADLKIFLSADPETRVKRRYKQLRARGINVSLHQIQADIEARDTQDRNRIVAPLSPAPDAHVIDSTTLGIDQVFAKVMAYVREFVL